MFLIRVSLWKYEGWCVCEGISFLLGSHRLITGNLRLSKLEQPLIARAVHWNTVEFKERPTTKEDNTDNGCTDDERWSLHVNNANTMLPIAIVQRWWTVIFVCKHKPEVFDPLHAANPLWSQLVNHPLLQINCRNGRYFTDKFYKHFNPPPHHHILPRVRTSALHPLPTAYIHKTQTYFKSCLLWLYKWFNLPCLTQKRYLKGCVLTLC